MMMMMMMMMMTFVVGMRQMLKSWPMAEYAAFWRREID